MRYFDRNILLNDIDPVITGIWEYLISVRESEILALPSAVDDVDLLVCPQEAKWLIGFWINKATSQPCKTPSKWMRSGIRPHSMWGDAIKERVASQLRFIRHWKIIKGDYRGIPEIEATWFIDPPYNNAAGKLYKHRINDYGSLREWVLFRCGQIVVCENHGADWLPFEMLGSFKSTEGSRGKSKSKEVVFTRSREEFLLI